MTRTNISPTRTAVTTTADGARARDPRPHHRFYSRSRIRSLQNTYKANFGELRKPEVELPRIPLLRTPVNSAGRRTVARRFGPMVAALAALYNAATFLPPSLTHLFSTTEIPFLHPPRGGGQGCGHRGASARQEGDRKRALHQTGSDFRDCTSAI